MLHDYGLGVRFEGNAQTIYAVHISYCNTLKVNDFNKTQTPTAAEYEKEKKRKPRERQ